MEHARRLTDQGREVISLCIGEPDFPTAEPILEAGMRVLQQGQLPYTLALGLPALREAISSHYAIRYGVEVPASRIVVTAGSSAALLMVMALLLDPGDEVLMTDPGYPCNRQFVRLAGGVPVGVPVDASTSFQITAPLLSQSWRERTRALLVATPANPTGMMIDAEQLGAIAAETARRGGHLIVDEIYHGLTYGRDAQTALGLSDEIIVINSFSKYFGMTGWRLGWMIVPDSLVRDIEKLAQNLYICPSTPAQFAALAAFKPHTIEIFEARRHEFQARRDFLLTALRALGFDLPLTPPGAFYLYAGCTRFTDDSCRFALELLDASGVAITPGIDFGANRPEQYVRFAYTTDIARLERAVNSIRRFLVR
jgi:aspartate/methionine/tyrosine aminotransferase